MKEILTEGLKKFGELPLHILSNATTFVWSSITNVFNVLLMAFNLFVIPVVTFYRLRDFDIIKEN
jgi:predicted PurR-regulated permease PerM